MEGHANLSKLCELSGRLKVRETAHKHCFSVGNTGTRGVWVNNFENRMHVCWDPVSEKCVMGVVSQVSHS